MSRHPKDRSGALLTFARARLSRLKQACCVLPALLALTVMACAGAPTPSTGSDLVGSPYPGGPWDPAELEGFLDRAISTQLDAEHLRGATVAVVRDGRLLLAKGYGFADEAGRTPVVADQTLFRIGSVTKLFTATAVMQLVEQGQLDLRADVNTYLRGFRIPATHPQPITLAHLLTHTAGFEERATIMPASSAELWPLGQHLANRQPARVRPPGELASYSNYGMALAGHIVAEVSGVPFERYIEDRILRPLEMRRSSVQQPPPPELDSLLSGGFMSVGGAFQPRPFEYVQDAPAGAVSATATDMANFMLAHLQHGRFGQQRILQDATAQEMQRRQFTHDPRLSSMAYGFYELLRNGQRAIVHGGDTPTFHSLLMLLPEQQAGLFVSYNTGPSSEPPLALARAFVDHYYPASDALALRSLRQDLGDLQQFTGSYWSTRSSQTTWLKLEVLLAPVTVSADGEQSLSISRLPGTPSGAQWVPIEPTLFRDSAGQETLAFRRDAQGRVTHIFVDNNPTVAYAKATWYEMPALQFAVLGACMLLFASAALGSLKEALGRRTRSVTAGGWSRAARRVVLLVCVLNLLFLGVLAVAELGQMAQGSAIALKALLTIPLLTTVLAFAIAALALTAWRQRSWGLLGRVHYTLVAVAALVFPVWLNYWNLLGYRL